MTSSLICLIGLRHRFSRLEAENQKQLPAAFLFTRSILCPSHSSGRGGVTVEKSIQLVSLPGNLNDATARPGGGCSVTVDSLSGCPSIGGVPGTTSSSPKEPPVDLSQNHQPK